MSKTEIKISAAIEKRKHEIKKLAALKPKIQKLIDDSEAAEDGRPCMSRPDWEKLKDDVEGQRMGWNPYALVTSIYLVTKDSKPCLTTQSRSAKF